jgi:predicted nucleic acid-binding protein
MLVAVDTNVLLDLALPKDVAHDAVSLVKQRVKSKDGVQLVAPPTVLDELHFLASEGEEGRERELAMKALQSMIRWGIRPMDLIPVGHGITETIAGKLRSRGIIPIEEVNDSLIIAECALANCAILITSDGHIADADASRMSLALKECDVDTVLVMTPLKIVRQFSPRSPRG